MLRGNIQKKTKHYQVNNPERTVTPVWKGLRKILESSYIVKTKNLKIKPPKKREIKLFHISIVLLFSNDCSRSRVCPLLDYCL